MLRNYVVRLDFHQSQILQLQSRSLENNVFINKAEKSHTHTKETAIDFEKWIHTRQGN